MPGPEIVCVGGISIDTIVHAPEPPSGGRCAMATAAHVGLGGKAANQAVAAARLGAAVGLIGAVGNDAAGAFAVRLLQEEGVALDGLHRHPLSATSTFLALKDGSGWRQTVVFPGANARVDPASIDAAAATIAGARVVTVQLEIPLEAVRRTIDMARQAGATIILDPSPARSLPADILGAAWAIKPNAAEAESLTGIRVQDVQSARAAAQRLLETGVQLVAVEAGSSGNLFLTNGEEIFIPLHEVEVVDRTGAGDALVAALAVSILEGMPLRDAARFSTAAAALTTLALGAQPAMPRREAIQALLRRLGR